MYHRYGGTSHNKKNLMNELSKVSASCKRYRMPHEVLLVLDGLRTERLKPTKHSLRLQITSLAVTKLDGMTKGGVLIGIMINSVFL